MRHLPGNTSRNRGRVSPFWRRSMRSKLGKRPNRLPCGSLGTRSRRPSPRPKLRRNNPSRSPNPRPSLRLRRRSPNPPNSRSAVPNPRTPLVPASLPV